MGVLAELRLIILEVLEEGAGAARLEVGECGPNLQKGGERHGKLHARPSDFQYWGRC